MTGDEGRHSDKPGGSKVERKPPESPQIFPHSLPQKLSWQIADLGCLASRNKRHKCPLLKLPHHTGYRRLTVTLFLRWKCWCLTLLRWKISGTFVQHFQSPQNQAPAGPLSLPPMPVVSYSSKIHPPRNAWPSSMLGLARRRNQKGIRVTGLSQLSVCNLYWLW